MLRVYVNTISHILPECSNHPGGHLKMFPLSATLVQIADTSVDPSFNSHTGKNICSSSLTLLPRLKEVGQLGSFALLFTPGKQSCLFTEAKRGHKTTYFDLTVCWWLLVYYQPAGQQPSSSVPGSWTQTEAGALCSLMAAKWGHTFLLDVLRACRLIHVPFIHVGQLMIVVWEEGRSHCGAPAAAAGTGVLRALVAAERPGEPVRGPKAVEAGKAEIPWRYRVSKVSWGKVHP